MGWSAGLVEVGQSCSQTSTQPTLSSLPSSNRCDSEKSPTGLIEQLNKDYPCQAVRPMVGWRLGGGITFLDRGRGWRMKMSQLALTPDRMGCGNVG